MIEKWLEQAISCIKMADRIDQEAKTREDAIAAAAERDRAIRLIRKAEEKLRSQSRYAYDPLPSYSGVKKMPDTYLDIHADVSFDDEIAHIYLDRPLPHRDTRNSDVRRYKDALEQTFSKLPLKRCFRHCFIVIEHIYSLPYAGRDCDNYLIKPLIDELSFRLIAGGDNPENLFGVCSFSFSGNKDGTHIWIVPMKKEHLFWGKYFKNK